MKLKKSICMKLLLLLAILFGALNYSNAQDRGILRGVISDKTTEATLPGATVVVAGTNNGTTTNIDGEYILTNIPEGTTTVIFSFVSYKTDTLVVDITGGETKVADVQLSPDNIDLEEIVISAQLLGQKKAISTQLNADAIVNVVSDDKIQELPDVNAAEAIARLPGIAINRSGGEGTKIVIRGMEPKYSAITVNGVRVPSNAANDRSVDLSLISPELLSGIEVYKAPLPNMDAESSAGTVNLKLRKAPDELKILAKGLLGYNDLNSDYGDYKGVLQVSNRIFDGKLGILAQGTIERFNRSGDAINYLWSQGSTDEETGLTAINGSRLTFNDNQEIRKRLNSSVNLDYDLDRNNSFSIFGLLSRTDRDRFLSTSTYNPNEPGIFFSGNPIENVLDLSTISLSGEHLFGKINADWSVSTSRSEGNTPYNFVMNFRAVSIGGLFDPDLNRRGHPKTFFDASDLKTDEIYLTNNDLDDSNTLEKTNLAYANFKIPFQISDKINFSLEFGGRYSGIERSRNVTTLSERFYYLGTDAVQRAAELYDGELTYIPSNSQLISIKNFENANHDVGINLENGNYFPFPVVLSRDKLRNWSTNQVTNFTNTLYALVNNYDVEEIVTAGYIMVKLNFGDMLTLIPGFRYEHSDNTYSGIVSSADGTYGQNGQRKDTVTYQNYGEFFPHLHLKFKPFDWFDVRASYAKTIARPDFNFVTPTAQINHSSTNIQAGNPELKYALSTSYDLNFSFFKPNIGLFTIGGFYKDIDNIFINRRIILTDPERAEENGWPGYSGYELNSYTNIPTSKVWGYEMEVQTNLSILPQPFSGIVISANYARLFSETEVIFLTSKTEFGGGFPPVPITTYFENKRTVNMPTQAPEIFRASVGYDYKGFSARVSGSYQGTKPRSYSLNKDFDSYDMEFWRWDASAKQEIGDRWSIFLNINNFTNQQDIRFTRNEDYIRTIETYGMTGTIGVQFQY